MIFPSKPSSSWGTPWKQRSLGAGTTIGGPSPKLGKSPAGRPAQVPWLPGFSRPKKSAGFSEADLVTVDRGG